MDSMEKSEIDSMNSKHENDPETIVQRMFKLESTRRKYERFVEIKAVAKSQRRTSSGFKDIEIVKYACRLCNKINSTQIGGTGNIRKHLMVIGLYGMHLKPNGNAHEHVFQIHNVDMDDLDATAFDNNHLETFKEQKTVQVDLEKNEEILNLTGCADNIDVSRRMFRNESTRLRYEKFVKIRDIQTSVRKQPKTSSKQTEIQESTETVKYECLLCYKILSTQVSGTGNIRKHLKVRKRILMMNSS